MSINELLAILHRKIYDLAAIDTGFSSICYSNPNDPHAHRFTRAVSVGNPREFLQADKEEQEMAEACKRLIKNCIICWNYLYLSQKLEDSEDIASREAFLEAVSNGSAVSWQHINLLGEYDFSDEKLQDTVGIKPPKLEDQRDTFLGGAKRAEVQGRNGLR